MDFRLLILTIGLAFAGCGTIEDTAEEIADEVVSDLKGEITLSLTFQTHRPHCGGMAPTPEQEQGYTNPLSGAVFYLYKDEMPAKKSQMIKLTTNAEGKFSIDLKKGMYHVVQEDKTLSLEEFMELKKVQGEHYNLSPDSCFKTWKETPDFSIDLSSDHAETVTISERCFTGSNPCIQYTGPYPP